LLSNLGAYSQVLAAHSAVTWWEYADGAGLDVKEKRIRRQRFFTFLAMAYEAATGFGAGLTWKGSGETLEFSGEFFKMAKICHDSLLPTPLQAASNKALGKIIDRALKRRTLDEAPRKPAGRRRTTGL